MLYYILFSSRPCEVSRGEYTHVCSVAPSCPILCNPMDYSPPGSSVHGFSRQECWSGSPCPPPGDPPNPGMEPTSPAAPALQADSLPLMPPGKPQVEERLALILDCCY